MDESKMGNSTYIEGYHHQTPYGKPLLLRAFKKTGLKKLLKPTFSPEEFLKTRDSLSQVVESLFGEANHYVTTNDDEILPSYLQEFRGVLAQQNPLSKEQIADEWGVADIIRANIQLPESSAQLGLDYRSEYPELLVVHAKGFPKDAEDKLRRQLPTTKIPRELEKHYY